MFAGGAHRPIGLGWMLCTSECHRSTHSPEIFNVITAQAGSGWVGKSVTGRWSQFTGHSTLHSPQAAASLVYSPALCCHPRMKEIEQDAAVPGGSHHADPSTVAITVNLISHRRPAMAPVEDMCY